MIRPAQLRGQLSRAGLSSLRSILLRLLRWYTSPSGLVLVAAAGSLALAFLGWGPQALFGILGVALLTGFLTYRFSRQQGIFSDALHRAATAQAHIHQASAEQLAAVQSGLEGADRELQDLLPRISAVERRIERAVQDIDSRIDKGAHHALGIEARVDNVFEQTRSIDYRLRHVDDSTQDLKKDVQAAGDLAALLDRVTRLEARLDATDARIDSTLPDSTLPDSTAGR